MNNPRIERILCPTDFSPFSDLALRHALALAWQFKASLKILHVVPHVFLEADSIYGAAPWLLTPEVRLNADEAMRDFIRPARERKIHLETEIREGDPWREIHDAAWQMAAGLVVMGTHGRGGLDRFLLGSVAEKLIRRLPCPVLSVCHEEGRTWAAPGLVQRILCATDFSETSFEAFRLAQVFAKRHGAAITLLNAVESIPELDRVAYRALIDFESVRRELERRSLERLREMVQGADLGDLAVTVRSVNGRAHKQILRIAAEERADLIFIGAQGHGFVEHMLSGSNAQRVIREATCPVLTARALPADLRPRARSTSLIARPAPDEVRNGAHV